MIGTSGNSGSWVGIISVLFRYYLGIIEVLAVEVALGLGEAVKR